MTSSSCLLLLRRSFRFHDLARACFASLVLPWCGRVERGIHGRTSRTDTDGDGNDVDVRCLVGRGDGGEMRQRHDGRWMVDVQDHPGPNRNMPSVPSLSLFLVLVVVGMKRDGEGPIERKKQRNKERKKEREGDGWVHTVGWEGRILSQGQREGIHPRWMGASTTDLDGSRQRPQTPLWIERERKDTATVPSPIHVGGGGVDLHPTLSRSTPWTQERVTTDRWKHPAIPGPTGTMHIPTPSIVQEDIARKKKQRDGDDNTTQINNEQSTTSDTSTWQDRPWLWRNANQTKPNHQTKIQAP